MTPAEREKAVIHLEQTLERMLRTTARLSPEQWQYKPGADCWSVAEIVEHVAFVESRILGGIERTLQKEPTLSKPFMEDDAFVQRIVGRADRMKAPDQVAPSGRWALDQLIPEFEAARQRSIEFAKTTEASLRQHCFAHPFFGPLDCYQWLLLIPSHGERHRRQAEEIIKGMEFPRAVKA